ncbi:MAG: metallophosphoesterase [Clostridia bacterium]|nr:metallophosphoesterase [Clostridia bacterium]
MNRFNKFLAFLICLILIFSLVACGANNTPQDSDTNIQNSNENITDTGDVSKPSDGEQASNDTQSEDNKTLADDNPTGDEPNNEPPIEEKDQFVDLVDSSFLKITLDREKSSNRKISLVASFKENTSGVFSLYYADNDGNKLGYYTAIKSAQIDNANKSIIVEDLIIPNKCAQILVEENSTSVCLAKIPEEYLGKKGYTFSALSDPHFNKGNYFVTALDFLDGLEIDFVGVAGDVTGNGELSYMQKFNNAIKDRKYPVYTVGGNHDTPALSNGAWIENMNTDITTNLEVVDIAKNGIDFVYKPTKMAGDVFVFLTQTSWSYPESPKGDEYTILTREQLEWLSGALEEYKDTTVYLFFHTLLSAPDGTQASAVGNLVTPSGYSYDLPYSYGAADEVELRGLLKKYKNVIYFSGHSHWMFELEKYNSNLNVSNFDGEYAYMVHVPSVCEPRSIDEDGNRISKTGVYSEGWILDVYDDIIVLTPVDFLGEVFYTEYMKIIPLK